MSKKDLYKQIFKITYLSMINGLIPENRYIDILQKLTMKGFKTYHINDFDKLSIYMFNMGIINSFNISILIHFRDINYKTLSEISKHFDDIRSIFSIKKKKMVKRIEEIRNIIREKLDVIKSFRKNERYNSIEHILQTDYNLSNRSDKKTRYLSNETIKKEWDYYTRVDIMNRLHLLVNNYYKLNELEYMNIELKLLSELNGYSCEQLESYYINVIRLIETHLREWLLVCKMYIDIEINYLECCKDIISNKSTILSLKNFSINITKKS